MSMMFLPIVDRELRVAARKGSTFWLRVGAALVGLAIGGGLLLGFRLGAFGMAAPGQVVFPTLTWLALAATLASGPFFTSNALSDEKREGTLGFLFLTDLRGYDVAGGKLVALSLRAFYGLLAFFPVLAFTFLFGGVANAQFWQTALALVNVLFCSLTVGLFISALSRSSQKAMAGTVILLLLLAVAGPCVDGIVSDRTGRSFRPVASLTSPVYVFIAAWNQGRSRYWPSLGLTQLGSWGLLALTCWLAPRTWQEKDRRFQSSRWLQAAKYGGQRRRRAFGRKWLERHPVFWLHCRERWQARVLWAMLALLTGIQAANVATRGFARAWEECQVLYIAGAMGLFWWAASQAGQSLGEARRSGFLELLLVSPLSLGQIIAGQWRAWLRLYGAPILGFLILRCLAAMGGKTMAWGMVTFQIGGSSFAPVIATSAMTLVDWAADLAALGWFGLWMGMTSKNLTLATFKTVVFVQVFPWIIISLLTLLVVATLSMSPMLRNSAMPSWLNTWITVIMTALPAGLTVAKDIGFVIWSRHQLCGALRRQAAEGNRPHRLGSEPSAGT